jgi:hypothetical protein
MATSIVGLNALSYPSYFNPSIINASALNPVTSFPVPLISTVPMVPTISTITPGSLPNTVLAPILPSVFASQDVNNDRNLREQVTNYFFDKLLKNWLKYHFLELYQLVIVSNGTANLIKDMAQATTNTKNDATENSIKYTFLVDNYMTKKDIYTLISQFRKINGLNWWDIKHYADKVRSYIKHKVTKTIKKDIVRSTKS